MGTNTQRATSVASTGVGCEAFVIFKIDCVKKMPTSSSLGYLTSDARNSTVVAPPIGRVADIPDVRWGEARKCEGTVTQRERICCTIGITIIVTFALTAITYVILRH